MKKILIALALIAAPFAAYAASSCSGYGVSNCMKQGGALWVIGGTQAIKTGGVLDVESGGALKIAGTNKTANIAALPVFRIAQDAVASGQTAKTVTVTGVTSASKCVAVGNEIPTNTAYIKSAAPGTDQVVVTVNTDPGASNLDITVICAD